MSKITALTEKTFQGKVTGHSVVLDNGTSGNVSDKDSDKGLKVGDEVIATIADYVSKAGKHSNLITLKLGQGLTTQNSSTPTPPLLSPTKAPHTVNIAQMKFDSRMKCLELANAGFLAGKLTDQEAKEHVAAWVSMADGLIDEIFTSR